MFSAPMRETVEMAYEFEHDFVVDHSDYADHFGDHSTPLADAFALTMGSAQVGIAGAA